MSFSVEGKAKPDEIDMLWVGILRSSINQALSARAESSSEKGDCIKCNAKWRRFSFIS